MSNKGSVTNEPERSPKIRSIEYSRLNLDTCVKMKFVLRLLLSVVLDGGLPINIDANYHDRWRYRADSQILGLCLAFFSIIPSPAREILVVTPPPSPPSSAYDCVGHILKSSRLSNLQKTLMQKFNIQRQLDEAVSTRITRHFAKYQKHIFISRVTKSRWGLGEFPRLSHEINLSRFFSDIT